MATILTKTAEETLEIGSRIGARLTGGETILLDAPLGAGKTVFAKGIADGLGVRDVVTSPTFTLVAEYPGRLTLVHADLYRIGGEDEYEQLALDEYHSSDSVLIVEWPDRAGGRLPEDAISVAIEILASGERRLTLPDRLASSHLGGV